MRSILKKWSIVFLLVVGLSVFGCASAPRKTLELSEVTEEQVVELQKSHLRFVQLYYGRLRDDVNDFVNQRWMPVFLSKVVQNEEFRNDLDQAYLTSAIEPSDVEFTWKGRPLPEPQKGAILSGVEKAVTDERSRLGRVLLDFSEEAQRQINKKRRELLKPIDEQERMVINEINAAYADLQGAQAAIKGYLASVVELKEKQELVLEKIGVLKRSEQIMNAALEANETLSVILQEKENAEEALKIFLEQMKDAEKRIKERMSGTKSAESPATNQ
ncbi:MAG: hypothetical protein PVG99_13375 [Desulfobacteraceae bacterium]|jgi:hypothetical protein